MPFPCVALLSYGRFRPQHAQALALREDGGHQREGGSGRREAAAQEGLHQVRPGQGPAHHQGVPVLHRDVPGDLAHRLPVRRRVHLLQDDRAPLPCLRVMLRHTRGPLPDNDGSGGLQQLGHVRHRGRHDELHVDLRDRHGAGVLRRGHLRYGGGVRLAPQRRAAVHHRVRCHPRPGLLHIHRRAQRDMRLHAPVRGPRVPDDAVEGRHGGARQGREVLHGPGHHRRGGCGPGAGEGPAHVCTSSSSVSSSRHTCS